ncbi:ABC transporter permease [Fusibacter sp. 3D3]|uniref:ABC transporter permease n=1 Tax=Fusibacter sp. 3D3 TaxID=1048380 RepID=UPI0008534CCC|nr:ABC transporter permease [Fusibacter sp. 3D3]GAU78820.1 ribose ABC transport system, permease protein RbsC [Fusibacter sp. 3D3]
MTSKYEFKKIFELIFKEYLILGAIAILVLVTSIVQPAFLSVGNLSNVIRQFGPLIMVALGMTFVIIGGFIDLSVAGIISLVAVATVYLIDIVGQGPALIIGIGIGIACGILNSALLLTSGALTQAEALFITYGMSLVYGALALIISGGSTQHIFWSENNTSLFELIGSGSVGFFSISFILFLICLLILYLLQNYTYAGRVMRLTGGNKTAAELCGVNINRSIIFIYAISGLMSAIGSIVLISRVTTASPVIGMGYETNAILAVVVGGTTLAGGKGSVMRTVLGTMLVILLSNCMNLLGVSVYLQYVLKGAILVIAIWMDNRKQS